MSTKPSIFEEAILTSHIDNTRSVDLSLGVLSVDYYESVMVPGSSMNVQVVDSGGSIQNQKGNLTTIYEGLPIRARDRFNIFIPPNSATNEALDFKFKPMIVRGVQNVIVGAKQQTFTLELVSEATVNNEFNFVDKVWKKTRISEIAQDILTNYLGIPATEQTIDETSNTLGYSGNQQKAFKALTNLAKQSISAEMTKLGASAGFFIYETTKGFNFRSIDNLIKQASKADYLYTEVNINECDFVPTPTLPSLDRKILNYTITKNQDLIDNLKKGLYATDRRYFDPYTFQVTTPKVGSVFNNRDYNNELPTLGLERIFEETEESRFTGADSFLRPTRILTDTLSLGTYFTEVSTEMDNEMPDVDSQALTRYNSLFSQAIDMLIPLNSTLNAGDIITIRIPENQPSGAGDDIDTKQVSGRYMIKELCHHYEADGSFTKLKIVRDTYGFKNRA